MTFITFQLISHITHVHKFTQLVNLLGYYLLVFVLLYILIIRFENFKFGTYFKTQTHLFISISQYIQPELRSLVYIFLESFNL